MPVFPEVGSTIVVFAGRDQSRLFGGVDHVDADAVFTDKPGFRYSSFRTMSATTPSAWECGSIVPKVCYQ
jgi:hypothetical protein